MWQSKSIALQGAKYSVSTRLLGNLLGCDAVCLRQIVLHGKGCSAFAGNNSPNYTAVGLQLQLRPLSEPPVPHH